MIFPIPSVDMRERSRSNINLIFHAVYLLNPYKILIKWQIQVKKYLKI